MNMIRLSGSLLIAFMFAQQLTAVFAQTSKDSAPAQRPSRYEELGLPEDGSSLYLPDEAYVRWPLPPGESATPKSMVWR